MLNTTAKVVNQDYYHTFWDNSRNSACGPEATVVVLVDDLIHRVQHQSASLSPTKCWAPSQSSLLINFPFVSDYTMQVTIPCKWYSHLHGLIRGLLHLLPYNTPATSKLHSALDLVQAGADEVTSCCMALLYISTYL